jgi:hypothetical protein
MDSEVPRPPATTSALAIVGVLLGTLGLLLGLLYWPRLAAYFGVLALLLGILGLWTVLRSRGRQKGAVIATIAVVIGVVDIGLPVAAYYLSEETARVASSNNLKEIGLGLHYYHENYIGFPPVALCDAAGKPLLSWRVLILPCVGQDRLFREFKLDEPWDGPNNSKLLRRMPHFYALPGDVQAGSGYTHYRVFVGNGAAFEKPSANGRGVRLTQFSDDLSTTIMIVEASEAVPWTQPDELDYDPQAPLPRLGGRFRGGFHVGMADGTVHWVGPKVTEPTLRAAITRAGGETLGPDW